MAQYPILMTHTDRERAWGENMKIIITMIANGVSPNN